MKAVQMQQIILIPTRKMTMGTMGINPMSGSEPAMQWDFISSKALVVITINKRDVPVIMIAFAILINSSSIFHV